MLGVILLVVLILLLIGALPQWPYAARFGYGYHPAGLLTLVLVIVLILILFGRL
jgi:uncharacterized protein DUF3309